MTSPMTSRMTSRMTFWTRQHDKQARSLRAVPTRALRAGIAKLESRLAGLSADTGELDVWLRAVDALTRVLLRLEGLLCRAERRNARVGAKRAMLGDAEARAAVLAEVGGEGALARWERRAEALAEAEQGKDEAQDKDEAQGKGKALTPPLAPPLAPLLAPLRLAPIVAVPMRGAVEGIAPLAPIGSAPTLYEGEAGFRLPRLAGAGAEPGPNARQRRTDGNGSISASKDRRRNWMAGIPVWPQELRGRARGEAERRAGQRHKASGARSQHGGRAKAPDIASGYRASEYRASVRAVRGRVVGGRVKCPP